MSVVTYAPQRPAKAGPPAVPPPLGLRLKAAVAGLRGGGFSVPFNNTMWNYGTSSGGSSTGLMNWGQGYYAGSDVDWRAEAGPLTQSSLVMAIINWLAGAFPEAPLQVMQKKLNGAVDIPDHPLTLLLDEPNPFYDGTVLWMATILSYNIDGNAYWIKWRNGAGEPVQVWYEPHFTIRPRWDRNDPTTFITHYEVNRNNRWYPVDVKNVVHFRWMVDPDNPRKGMMPLGSAFREIFTDKEGGAFSAITLKNLGWPSFVIAPDNVEDEIVEKDATTIKNEFEGDFTKDNRGRVMVSPRAIKIHTWAWSPEQLNLKALRQLPAERVSALLRVPAEVTGLILDHKTYNNVSEAREQAYESNLVPCWRIFAKTITRSFRDDYPDWTDKMFCQFDQSQVRVLQEDYNRKATTIGTLFKSNVIMQDEARVALNFDELEGGKGKRFWFEMVPMGVGGGGSPQGTGGLGEAEAGNAPKPPAAPAKPTDEQPGGTNDGATPNKKVLADFAQHQRKYALLEPIGTNGNGYHHDV